MSRVCEEFHCVPSVAMREIETLPHGLLEAIVLYRSYRALKDELAAAEERNDQETASDDRFRPVLEIQVELMRRRQAAHPQD